MLTGDKLLKVYNNKHNSVYNSRGAQYFEILYALKFSVCNNKNILTLHKWHLLYICVN